jgi:replication-associated recombination protein RarA
MTTNYDPWTLVRTRHELAADEVISALQKEIRRGNSENAVLLAYEMATTSAELEAYLWKRLQVIAVEDIGWGDLQAPVLVRALWEMVASMGRGDGERLLLAVHAVRYLCACQKDRSSDEMVNWVIQAVEKEGRLPQIPDYALDVHTRRGKEMGRGLRHFWEVGAQLNPELEGREMVYRERVLKALAGEENQSHLPNPEH